MEELCGVYLTSAEAADIMGKSEIFVAQLCQRDKLPGVKKFGKSWLIPIESAKNYVPDKRGPKSLKDKIAEEKAAYSGQLQEQ